MSLSASKRRNIVSPGGIVKNYVQRLIQYLSIAAFMMLGAVVVVILEKGSSFAFSRDNLVFYARVTALCVAASAVLAIRLNGPRV